MVPAAEAERLVPGTPVKAEAGQSNQRITFTCDTEENAIREVTGLLTHLAKGVAAWKAQHSGFLAYPSVAPSPSSSPTPSGEPSTLAAMPRECRAAEAAVAELVPDATTKATSVEVDGDHQSGCTWRNRVHSGNTTVAVRQGATVVLATYAGAAMPANSATNGPGVRLMAEREANAGALAVAKAVIKVVDGKRAGS